jgi:hypothetical protein
MRFSRSGVEALDQKSAKHQPYLVAVFGLVLG